MCPPVPPAAMSARVPSAHPCRGDAARAVVAVRGRVGGACASLTITSLPAIHARDEAKIRKGDETILFVEDEHAVRMLGRDLLLRHGYRVLEAENAEQAIGLADRFAEPIDLLLTDVVMPGRSGPELFRYLAQQRDGLKVMYLSGYSDDAMVRRGQLGPGAAFMQKPFTAKGLMKKLRDVLDRPSLA